MAGPRPDDNYNPVPEVAPQTGMPSDTLSVRASGANFGAQEGQAVSKVGDTLKTAENEDFAVETQRLGLANEHAATAAEMQLAVQGGQIYDKYKSLEGLDAANSKDAAVKDYMALSDKIRSGLGNPAAQRAYDQMATRRMSFTIQDMNSYSADQTKKAYSQGNAASSKLAVESVSRYEVANNPAQLGNALGTVIFNTNTDFTAPDYGKFRTVPATTDSKTGKLVFDTSTSQGKTAQAVYDNEVNTQTDQVFTNAVKTIAFDAEKGNVDKAVKFLTQNKDKMSPATYANLNHSLYGPYQNEQAREDSTAVMSNWSSKYQQQSGQVPLSDIPNQIKELIPGAVITSTARTPEHNKEVGGVDGSMHLTGQAADVVLPLGTTAADLKSQLAAKGINPTEFIDEGTHVHVGWASKNGQIDAGVGPMIGGGTHQSQVDFYSDHEPEMIEETRDRVAARGGDVTRQDAAVQRLRSSLAELKSNQDGEVRSLSDFIGSKINDPNHPITNMDFLDHSSDPDVKTKWQRLQELDWTRAGTVQRMVNSNAEGRSSTYGTDFYSHYRDFISTDSSGKQKASIDDLSPYFGGDKSPISNTGVKVLAQTAEDMKTPQGRGFRHAESQFLEKVHGQVTGTKVFPGINPAILKDGFDKQLMELIPQIEAKRADLIKQGKNPTDMFDENNKTDYVGKNIKPLDFDKGMKALVTSSLSGSGKSISNVNPGATSISSPAVSTLSSTYASIDDVGAALASGKIKTREEAYQIIKDKFGGFAPGVPKPQ